MRSLSHCWRGRARRERASDGDTLTNLLRVSPAVAFFVNSAFAFASAQLLTAALHEAGHGIVAQLLGFSPHIYAFFEDNPAGNARQTLTILAAGPVASLVFGALFWLWYRRSKPRYGFGRLLLLWLALLGVMTFINYLIVTPWLSPGDTAQFADVLGWPTTARYGMAAFGVVLLVALARPAATAVLMASPRAVSLDSPSTRRRYLFHGFYLPLIAGVALTALAGNRRPVAQRRVRTARGNRQHRYRRRGNVRRRRASERRCAGPGRAATHRIRRDPSVCRARFGLRARLLTRRSGVSLRATLVRRARDSIQAFLNVGSHAAES